MTISAIEAFGRRSAEYVSGRPEYPDALLGDLPPADVIVELGAGTGKLTALLARSGASRIIAIEPQPAMASHIPAAANVEIVIGTAEQIPAADASADLVCAGTAFHWFDYDKATKEILRIARPGAHLALIWNKRDERVPWVGEITGLFQSYRGPDVPHRDGGGIDRILSDTRFELVREREHAFEHRMLPDGIVDRVLSTSYIAALPPAQQEVVVQKVRAIISADPELAKAAASAAEIGFPYVCKLYLLRCTVSDPGRI